MSDKPDPVKTFVEYGSEFVDKHQAELGNTAATWGGMVMGLLRALYECDYCPGVFRVHIDDKTIRCPKCGRVWEIRE